MSSVRITGFAMLALSCGCLMLALSAEIGMTVWLAVLAISGIASLLVAALAPRFHFVSPFGLTAVGFAFVTAMSLLRGLQ